MQPTMILSLQGQEIFGAEILGAQHPVESHNHEAIRPSMSRCYGRVWDWLDAMGVTAVGMRRFESGKAGWGTWIRTTISRVRVCCPTVRRSPKREGWVDSIGPALLGRWFPARAGQPWAGRADSGPGARFAPRFF